ncbi:MAG: F0F1 ATP synthase subunit C [Deltaproteobacteria bacterium]|nr:F0F1 ATP synthase subunit C [Deltaproteobacteria bacterium]
MSASDRSLLGLAAMGAVGISCIASGLALGKIGSAALGAMSEKPELGGRALIFLGMAEGIAIYGLIIAIMILNKI